MGWANRRGAPLDTDARRLHLRDEVGLPLMILLYGASRVFEGSPPGWVFLVLLPGALAFPVVAAHHRQGRQLTGDLHVGVLAGWVGAAIGAVAMASWALEVRVDGPAWQPVAVVALAVVVVVFAASNGWSHLRAAVDAEWEGPGDGSDLGADRMGGPGL